MYVRSAKRVEFDFDNKISQQLKHNSSYLCPKQLKALVWNILHAFMLQMKFLVISQIKLNKN